jgi:hypothetical protein
MANRSLWDGGGRGWGPLVAAVGVGAAIVALLAVAVVLLWTLGRAPAGVPAVGIAAPPTPTPRALSFAAMTPAAPPAEIPSPAAVPTTEAPAPTAASAAPSDGGDAGGLPARTLFAAPGAVPFADLARGSWSAIDGALASDRNAALAEPWLVLVPVPAEAFAVEAELRVTGLLATVCDQSFGLVAGAPGAGQVYGGGVLFPCAEQPSRARLTDVSVWADGYNVDPVLAERDFAPGDEWRTYRFELRGDRLRLIVDGVELLAVDRPAPAPGAAENEVGLWAQGVGVEARRIEVFPLPA